MKKTFLIDLTGIEYTLTARYLRETKNDRFIHLTEFLQSRRRGKCEICSRIHDNGLVPLRYLRANRKTDRIPTKKVGQTYRSASLLPNIGPFSVGCRKFSESDFNLIIETAKAAAKKERDAKK